MFRVLVVFTFLLASAVGQEIIYNYDDGPLGPANWADLPIEGNQCGGSSQSPIDIVTQDAVETSTGYYFQLDNWDRSWDHMTLTNDGHTVILQGFDNHVATPTLVYYTDPNSPSDEYIWDSLHFHFGGNNSVGAEHTVDGFRNSMEMHTVFHNTKYASLPDAKNYPDGVVVVGVHFEIGHHNKNFEPVISALPDVVYVNQVATISPGFPLQDLYPRDMRSAYSYTGSLTTPICQEVVQWFVLEEHVIISEQQIEKYRDLRTVDAAGRTVPDLLGRSNVDADTYMFNNFRPTQPLNGRVVYHHTPIFGSPCKNDEYGIVDEYSWDEL